jgi:hypothetical protein
MLMAVFSIQTRPGDISNIVFVAIITLGVLPFVIPGVICLRKGFGVGSQTRPAKGSTQNWWWLLPLALGFVGGIASWAKQKVVNPRKAMNMLICGIVVTVTWPTLITSIDVLSSPPVYSPTTSVIFEDDFSDPNSGWLVGSDASEDCKYQDGSYRMLVKKAGHLSWSRNMEVGQLDDFVFEVDARWPPEATAFYLDMYGIVFREQDNENYYDFLIFSGYGKYAVGKTVNGGAWSPLKAWTDSPYIQKGTAANRLKVVCQGPEISVYVNGNLLTTVTD